MTATLISWFLAFDDVESWKVVSRKLKKSPSFNCRKQNFSGEPRGSERPLFQVCCPGPGSVSKESDSGPSFSFSGGIPGSRSESQLDFIHDPAVKRLDDGLSVRYDGACSSVLPCQRGSAFSGPLSRRQPGFENAGKFKVDRGFSAVLGEHSHGNHGVTVSVPGGAGCCSSPGVAIAGSVRASHAAMSKRLSEKTDAFAINKRDLEDGIVAVRSAHGVLRDYGGADTAHVTAGESPGGIGLLEVIESDFSSSSFSVNSCLGLSTSACARASRVASASAGAGARVCVVSSSSAVSAVAHAHASTLHDAHNSWSDTGRVQGPTGRRCNKGRVSGPAEDLRPVSEVEAGVNFRLAGGVRGQVVGSFSGQQPGTGTRTSKGSVVTPSLHPEVPDSLSVSPGPGKRIRQLMGWTKVCGTAQSGIWLLKGNARACMFPANLDYLRVGWRKQGSYKTAWVTPGQVCLCSYQYGHGAAVRPQTNKAIWDGVIGLWGRVAPFLSPWCGKKELPTGVNLNHYDGSRSCVRWHSDNEPLFGPRDSPKLIVSLSLGYPVEFKVRRVSDNVTSSITLDHGDILVMDGSAQSEYLHCTMPGLQGPRVNLTYRWVAQHTASCPLAGVVGCLLPSCVQGLPEPGSRFWDKGENNWSFSWELAFLLFILMSVLLVSIWMNARKECRNSGQCPSCSLVHFPTRGRARWVGGRRWPLSRRSQFSRKRIFYFPWGFSWGTKLCLFFRGMAFIWVLLLDMLVAMREPTPCYRDAYSVGIPKGACGGKSGQNHCKTTVSPLSRSVFLVSKRTLYFFWGLVVWMLHIGRARHPGPGGRTFIPGQLSIEFANVGGWLTYGDLAMDSCAQFLAVAEHRLIPARARSIGHQLRIAGFHSVWAPACQDSIPGGHAGVGVVSLGGAPLALPSFITPDFQEFFRLGRVLRTTLPTGKGGVVHLFVVYGYQGAEEDAEKLRLTDRLLQAVLTEAQVVCTGQPLLIAGDLNADPAVIPCLAKGMSAGRYVDLALAHSLGAGSMPGITCTFNRDDGSGSRRDFLVGCSNTLAASVECGVTDRWFPPHFSVLARFRFDAWTAEVACPVTCQPLWPACWLDTPDRSSSSSSRSVQDVWGIYRDVLGIVPDEVVRALRDAASRSSVDDFWSIWSKGAEDGLLRAYTLAGGPVSADCSSYLGRGFLRIRRRRLGGTAVGGMGSSRLYRVSRGDEVDCHCSQFFVHSSLSPVLLFRRRLKSVADVLKGIRNKGFSQSRWDALVRYWGAVCRHGPCGPIVSLHPWENWIPPDLHGFYRWIFDSLDELNRFLRQAVIARRDEGIRRWKRWLREDLSSRPYAWLRPDFVPPSPFLVVKDPQAQSSHVVVQPHLVDAEFRKAWMPYFCRSGHPQVSVDQFLGFIGHFLPQQGCLVLPRITGRDLQEVAHAKKSTAGGLDGWAWNEIKALPLPWFSGLAILLELVESTGIWPQGLLDAYIAMIPKADGDSTPLGQRPLSVLPVVYRLWASLRLGHLREWVEGWLPKSVYSLGNGLSSVEAWFSTALDIEDVLSGTGNDQLHVMVADVIKSFDTVDRSILDCALGRLGLPGWFRRVYFSFHSQVRLRFKLAAGLGEPWCRDGGIPQGCPLSMVFIVALYVPWCRYLESLPGIKPQLYADNLKCSAFRPRALFESAYFTAKYVRLVGQDVSPGKCVLLSTSRAVRRAMKLWDISGNGGFWKVQLDVRDLGGHLDFTHRSRAGTLSRRVGKATDGVAAVGALPLGFLTKLDLVRGKFIPAGLHAAEASYVSSSSISAFRAAIVRSVWSSKMPLANAPAILNLLDGPVGVDPAYHVVWSRFRMMRRYLAYCPEEEPRIFRMLDLISRGAPGHGPVHLLLLSAAEVGFAWDGAEEGWIRVSLPPLRMMAGPIQHFGAAILDAWRFHVFSRLAERKGFWGVEFADFKGSLQLLNSPHLRERDKMLLRAILCGGVWNGFLLGKAKKEDVPCRFCGKRDGDGHLFWECTFPPLQHVRDLPEFAFLMTLDRSRWPRCLLWHGWLPGLSGMAGNRPWASSFGELASFHLENCLGSYPVDFSAAWSPPDYWDADDIALEMPDHPNIWTDGSREDYSSIGGFEVAGAGTYLPASEIAFDHSVWGTVEEYGDARLERCRAFLPVPGVLQSVQRAEFWGAIVALQAYWPCHLGIDNLNVVRSIGSLLEADCLAKPLALVKDGDLIALVQHMIRARGRDTVRVTKVKGHAEEVDVHQGRVRLVDKQGNAEADVAADLGRRHQGEVLIDARRKLLGARSYWYPIVTDLHRFMIAIARVSVNHDGRGGTAPDPLVWDQGSRPKVRRHEVRVTVDLASLPGPPGFLSSDWVQVHAGPITGADIAAWPYSVGILVRFSAFLGTLHWPSGAVDMGHFGVSFLELLILFEQWSGQRLLSEKVTRPHVRAGRPILVSSVPASEGIEIRHGCQFLSSLVRALGKLEGGLGRFLPCHVGSHLSRLRHLGWNQCSHGLTSRPLETCHHRCLSAVCGILGYPKGSAAELLDGVLKLRCCSTPFSHRFPTWYLPSVGDGRFRDLGDVTGPLVGSGNSGVKRVRLTRKTRVSVSSVRIPDQGHSTSRRWKRLRPPSSEGGEGEVGVPRNLFPRIGVG